MLVVQSDAFGCVLVFPFELFNPCRKAKPSGNMITVYNTI